MTRGIADTEGDAVASNASGWTRGCRALFCVRALHGPPRPVLVLSVSGEVDRTNDAELVAQVRRTAMLARTGGLSRQRFGCRAVARTVVVDLREAAFVGARALGLLASERDGDGRAVRVVAPRDGVVSRALAVVRPSTGCHVYSDLADAVLGEDGPWARIADQRGGRPNA